MKLWLCVLSALLLAGCTAGTDVPGSVTPTAVPTPAATETGETAEAAATPAPTADAEFEQHFGKKAARRRKIYNGMIPCQLYMYFEQPKRERK